MQLSYKIDAGHRSQLTKLIGSFWTTLFSEPREVRTLLGMSRQNRALNDLKSSFSNLLGDHEDAAEVTCVEVPFDGNSVIVTGDHFYEEPATGTYGGAHSDARIYGTHRVKYFGLKLSTVLPKVLQTHAGKMFLGVDFFLAGDYIYFRKDPRLLFPNYRYIVARGINLNHRSYLSYLLRTTVRDNEDLVVQYFRTYQTPKYFQLFLAVVAGQRVLREKQKLLEIHQLPGETIYVFEKEALRVDYKHIPLVVGTVYPDLHIIGESVQVFFNDGSKSWWRKVDWRGGIILDPFIKGNFGLKLLDALVPAYQAGSDPTSVDGSKLHARIRLSDDYDTEKLYWEKVAKKETRTARYFNSQLKLGEEAEGKPDALDTFSKLQAAYIDANIFNEKNHLPKEYPEFEALPGAKMVNALDTMFQAILGHTAVVIVVDTPKVKFPGELLAVLSREFPVGCTPIVLSHAPDLSIETFDLSYSIGDENKVKIYLETPLVLSLTVDLSEAISGFSEIKTERPL